MPSSRSSWTGSSATSRPRWFRSAMPSRSAISTRSRSGPARSASPRAAQPDRQCRHAWQGLRRLPVRSRHPATLTIADRGRGIPPELLGKAFEPFFRVDPGRRQSIPGAGLGLAIAKEIIERHGGAITLETRAGGGLSRGFRRSLLIVDACASYPDQSRATSSKLRLNRERYLRSRSASLPLGLLLPRDREQFPSDRADGLAAAANLQHSGKLRLIKYVDPALAVGTRERPAGSLPDRWRRRLATAPSGARSRRVWLLR